jgi:hypothetical protein
MTTLSKQERIEQVHRFLSMVFTPDEIVEIRALSKGFPMIRLFRDKHHAARAAITLNDKYERNVYFCLNPIAGDSSVALLHAIDQPKNDQCIQGAKDTSIACRRLYLIDVDPRRPCGAASTDEELAAAREVATKVKAFLTQLKWPDPIELCSGNGIHLLYRGDGCSPHSDSWRFALKYISERFSNDKAHVDTVVTNAARISRLPGGVNRKGNETPERPHRMAHVISFPSVWEPLMHAKIYKMASLFGYGEKESFGPQARTSNNKRVVIDKEGVHGLIKEFPEQLKLHRVTEDGDRTWFGLSECPFKGAEHPGQNVDKGKSALILSSEFFGFHCFSDECQEHTIGDLLRHLHSKTDRRSTQEIWVDDWDIEEAFERMGVQDAYDPFERPMTMAEIRAFIAEEDQ